MGNNKNINMNKIKVILNYNLTEESDEIKFKDIDGDYIGEIIGQESALEIINSLDELDREAVVQLVDENDNIIKEKKVKIGF